MKKIKIVIIAVLITGLFPLQGFAQKLPIDSNVRIGQLKNGFTYYLRNNPKPENRIEFRLAVKAGSVLEGDDQQGLAHFTEHMLFNGTKNFEKNELIDFLQKMGLEFGGDLNAYTSFDETVYILPIPTENPQHIDDALLLLSNWAHQATFDNEEIDKERGVVMEEWRLRLGAYERMRQQIKQNGYWASMMASYLQSETDFELILKGNEIAQAITKEKIVQVANEYLTKENMIKAVKLPERMKEGGLNQEIKKN